ncbi:MAG TPA: hypothetical protein PLL09_10585 [Flavobacterium sp.]|uniref:hypothetical protein n=2 Tax=Flavobacterium TaxID=237 RepID=UPI0025C44266|nr:MULTISPECIES: hypothetical protein [unclassified Flavobacterium]HRE78256.1 hypothetical protein [Flavobacterium sp.]
MIIETKRNILKFYFATYFGFLFFSLLGTFMIKTFFDEIEEKGFEYKLLFMLIFGIAVIILSFYTIFKYHKNAPFVKVFDKKIQINKKTINFQDIKYIDLTGKMPFKYILTFPMEGCYILLKNEEEIFLYDDMYTNLWKIKDYLNSVYLKKEIYKLEKPQEIKKNIERFESFNFYSGNQIFSFRGLMLWGFLIPLSYGLLFVKQDENFNGYMLFGLFAVFWFYFSSWLMHYYGVSKKFLIIKNTNLPWKEKIYFLDNIKEVVFECEGKMPNCLRVITHDFKSNLYPGATLSDKKWITLKKELRSYGVIVRDECINFD